MNEQNFLQTALEAASRAKRVVQDGASGELEVRTKSSPKDLVTQVDLASERVIRETLHAHVPNHSVLGEEGGLTGESAYRWVIDPIDGTSNFARRLPHYGISIGLEHDGKGVVGVVVQPVLEDVYHAEAGAGCFKNGSPIRVSGCESLNEAYVSMSFSTDRAVVALASSLWDVLLLRSHTLRRLGSTALELAWLAEGKTDAFIGFGQGAWDIAAGRVLVQEAGGAVMALDDGITFVAAASEGLLAEIIDLMQGER